MSIHRIALLLAAALTLGPTPTLAAVSTLDSGPVWENINGIRVVTGGITTEEADAFKRMAGEYRMRLVLANRNGDYRIAKNMRIMQGSRTVLSLAEAGPWVLADLPSGRYRVIAEVGGEEIQKTLILGPHSGTVIWTMPARLD